MERYHLIVVGGGISGVAAAVSAAREGLRVLLIERYGCLGGSMSHSLVFPFMRYTMKGSGKLLSDGIFTEMRERKDRLGDASWEYFKMVFDDMVAEAGVTVLFHASVIGAACAGNRVQSVEVATKNGKQNFEADFFVDASGDGELLAMSGCEFQLGRESDGLSQPMTTCFRICGVDLEQFRKDQPMLEAEYERLYAAGKFINPRENILSFIGYGKGVLHMNTTRVIRHDPTDPWAISRAEMIGRKQVAEMMEFLRSHSKAFDRATLISMPEHIGVRESRKLKGVHILTAEELKACTEFNDAIAYGCYMIDIHNPTGAGSEHFHFKDDEFYQIPYRCLLPKEYVNLLAAGRCISATHEAHSAIRIMPICACIGQAAGVAAAIAFHTGTDAHTVNVNSIQKKL